MSWLKLITLTLQALAGLVAFLRERQLIAAGEAKAIAEAWEISNERIKEALAAREAARDSEPDPDDRYRRD